MDVSTLAELETQPAEIVSLPRGRTAPNYMSAHYDKSRELGDATRKIKTTAQLAITAERQLRKYAHDTGYGVSVQVQLGEDGSGAMTLKAAKALAKEDPERIVWVAFSAGPLRQAKQAEEN